MKAREFVFKKPYLGTTNFKAIPLKAKNKWMRSIHDECAKNSFRVTKLFRLRMVDIIPEIRLVTIFDLVILSVLPTYLPIFLF